MSTTYRAAYFAPATGNGVGIVLTSEDQAGMTDAELRAAAHATAVDSGLIGDDAEANQVTEDQFADGLHIGMWTE